MPSIYLRSAFHANKCLGTIIYFIKLNYFN